MFVYSSDPLLEVFQTFLKSQMSFVDFHFEIAVVVMRSGELNGAVGVGHGTIEFLTHGINIGGRAMFASTSTCSWESDGRILVRAFSASA